MTAHKLHEKFCQDINSIKFTYPKSFEKLIQHLETSLYSKNEGKRSRTAKVHLAEATNDSCFVNEDHLTDLSDVLNNISGPRD